MAIISKQMFAEKQNGAISRRVSALNSFVNIDATNSSAISAGEIRLFAGASFPSSDWLVCDGNVLARVDYPKLFDVIGTLYGTGAEADTHFRLPDLRGRVAVGVDAEGVRAVDATRQLGSVGGQAFHQLTAEQLPSHQHGTGSLAIISAGAHTHGVTDPGHNHGGRTELDGVPVASNPVPGSKWSLAGVQYHNVHLHNHIIPHGYTHLSINSDGLHSHGLEGETSAVGKGQHFSIMPPYQAINYIIYTG